MSTLLADTVTRLFTDLVTKDAIESAEKGVWPEKLWRALEEGGLTLPLVAESAGGAGLTWLDAHVMVRAAGRHVAPVPLAETIVAGALLSRAGLDVPLAEVKRVLGRLGFFVAGERATVKIAVPSWRPDVEGKADIVEEVVRILGVDRVPATPFDRGEAPRKPVLTTGQVRVRKAKRALAARGLVEAVTWSFVAKPDAERFAPPARESTYAISARGERQASPERRSVEGRIRG